MPKTDPELLAGWLERGHEPAFHELVRRYAGLVHTTARRTSGDESLAAEISQLVFISLARKARSLGGCASLGGWLHRTTLWHAANLKRKRRREIRKRELLQTAMENDSPALPADEIWREIQPVLDGALAALSAKDREALLLRFYRSLTVREVAATLGTTTAAAQKRIDRATARLREKLAKRGCTTAGTLAAALATGLAADASATVPAVSILATKAIAAAAVGSGLMPAALTFFTFMKSASLIPPLVALTVSVAWIGMRRHALAGLERDGKALTSSLAAALTDGPAVEGSRRITAVPASDDPKALLARASEFFLRGGMREAERYFATVPNEKILAAMDRIDQLDSQVRNPVEELLSMMLIHSDPQFALDHLIFRTTDRREGMTSQLSWALQKWVTEDPRAAAAWFDRELQNGAFASKRLDGQSEKREIFESALMAGLLKIDLEAASARLATLPEDRRQRLINEFFNQETTSEDPVGLAGKIRELLPQSGALRMLERQTSQIVQKDGFPAASEFLTLIDGTEEERATFAEAAAGASLNRISYRTKITRKEVDELRAWLKKEAPEAIDRATGTALGGIADSVIPNFSDVAALAIAYHESSGNDDVLYAFLSSWGVRRRPAEARVLAEKIVDGERRDEILRNLK